MHLTVLADPDRRPYVGQVVFWPGDDREWIWNGSEWIGTRTAFDGGDAWEGDDE